MILGMRNLQDRRGLPREDPSVPCGREAVTLDRVRPLVESIVPGGVGCRSCCRGGDCDELVMLGGLRFIVRHLHDIERGTMHVRGAKSRSATLRSLIARRDSGPARRTAAGDATGRIHETADATPVPHYSRGTALQSGPGNQPSWINRSNTGAARRGWDRRCEGVATRRRCGARPTHADQGQAILAAE
jgi:hypothetical protein